MDMKKKCMAMILLCGSVTLLVGCAQPSVDTAAAEAELRAAVDAYHEAGASADVAKLVALYTTDGVMLPPNAAEEKGLDEIRAYASEFTQAPGFAIRFSDISVGVAASGDMGYSLANAVISADGVDDTVRDFHLWKKEDGAWKVAVDIWNSELPLPMAEASDPLQGTWEVTSQANADGTVVDPAGPGQYIFNEGRYSAAYTIGTSERPRSAESFNPTDAEKLAQYDSIIVNSGTYTIDGTTVTLRPMIAKSPEFIGGASTMAFSVDGDTLTLTTQTLASQDGATPGDAIGSSMTLQRVE
jgi:ketosteroid isomerase-like protein